MKQKQREKRDALWSKVVYKAAYTGEITDNANKCLLSLTLPARAGKYLCKYSCAATGTTGGTWWIFYTFKLNNQIISNNGKNGIYLPANASASYPFPLSGSVVIELNGQENEQQRKLGLWHLGHSSHPSGISNICIEAHELKE